MCTKPARCVSQVTWGNAVACPDATPLAHVVAVADALAVRRIADSTVGKYWCHRPACLATAANHTRVFRSLA
jgi:hypothetical protein